MSDIDIPLVTQTIPKELHPITTLGRGSYGKVVLAKNKEEELIAVKIVAKNRIKSRCHLDKTVTELRVLKEVCVKSNFLVQSRGSFQTRNCLVYTMSYNAGGELFFHLQREGRFSESKCRLICMQVIIGLETLHENGVLYRDLKPENILITSEGHCQIADFGLSKFLPMMLDLQNEVTIENKPRKSGLFSRVFKKKSLPLTKSAASLSSAGMWGTTKTRCGTPAYQSPEIVEAKEHGLEADWWALGVFLFELLTGDPPFFANTVKEVYEIILRNRPVYPKRISENAKAFISSLLTSDRFNRLGYNGVLEVKQHPFFTEGISEVKHKDNRYTWEQVEKRQTPPVVFLSETGIVGSPEDAIYFHADFTSIDVREYVVPIKSQLIVEGFTIVEESEIEQFVSAEPIAIVEKSSNQTEIFENDPKKV